MHGRRVPLAARQAPLLAAGLVILPLLAWVHGLARPAASVVAYDAAWRQVAVAPFGGPGLDPNRWDLYNGLSANPTESRTASYVSVGHGVLDLHTDGQLGSGLCWCGARAESMYGRWEVRERMGAAAQHGEATLLWPANQDWPAAGEIDISEMNTTQRNLATATVHYSDANRQLMGASVADFTQWHTFAVEWEPYGIRMWMDGKAFFATSNPAAIPRTPMFLAIQAGPNTAGAAPVSADLQVDWVKVFAP